MAVITLTAPVSYANDVNDPRVSIQINAEFKRDGNYKYEVTYTQHWADYWKYLHACINTTMNKIYTTWSYVDKKGFQEIQKECKIDKKYNSLENISSFYREYKNWIDSTCKIEFYGDYSGASVYDISKDCKYVLSMYKDDGSIKKDTIENMINEKSRGKFIKEKDGSYSYTPELDKTFIGGTIVALNENEWKARWKTKLTMPTKITSKKINNESYAVSDSAVTEYAENTIKDTVIITSEQETGLREFFVGDPVGVVILGIFTTLLVSGVTAFFAFLRKRLKRERMEAEKAGDIPPVAEQQPLPAGSVPAVSQTADAAMASQQSNQPGFAPMTTPGAPQFQLQPGYPANSQLYPGTAVLKKNKRVMTSLVLGIISVVLNPFFIALLIPSDAPIVAFLYFIFYVIIFAVAMIGVIFGALAIKRRKELHPKDINKALVGTLLSSIGLGICVLMLLFIIIGAIYYSMRGGL